MTSTVEQHDWIAEEMFARVRRLELRVDELDELFPDGTAGGFTAAGAGNPHLNLNSWVRDVFAVTFARPLGGEWRWCVRWHDHPEAVLRLEALWKSFETLRRDPDLGMATWLRDHLDPQLPILLGSRGPFAQCGASRHECLAVLPLDLGD